MNGKAGHLRLGKGAAHGVGVDHRNIHLGGDQQGFDAVAAADLDRHNSTKLDAQIILDGEYRFDGEIRIGQTFLADQRRTHGRHDGDPVVIVKCHGIQQPDPCALAIELADVEVTVKRAAAATGTQNPRAGRHRLQLVFFDDPFGCHG